MSITSDEVNYLIYRYMQESGMSHSSFVFGYESHILKSDFKNVEVTPGALLQLLQKGLLYLEAETHIQEDGTEKSCSRPFNVLYSHVCETLAPPTSSATSSSTRKNKSRDREERRKSSANHSSSKTSITAANPSKTAPKPSAGVIPSTLPKSTPVSSTVLPRPSLPSESLSDSEKMEVDIDGDSPISTPTTSAKAKADQYIHRPLIASKDVLVLSGHSSSVFVGHWNPQNASIIASGLRGNNVYRSADSTIRLWTLPLEPFSNQGKRHGIFEATITLDSFSDESRKSDVTTVAWSPDGDVLVGATSAGDLRFWDNSGNFLFQHTAESTPILVAKWNLSGKWLLTAGAGKSTHVRDRSGAVICSYQNHKGPVLDLDWRNESQFASCCVDGMIHVYDVDIAEHPIRIFSSHTDEVNCIRWNSDGSLLASCSDDHTVKIWGMDRETCHRELQGHEKQVYTLSWRPAGPGSPNPQLEGLLATSSVDHTVKLWNPWTGQCVHDLRYHTDAVYSVAFSPDGRHLASGSLDARVAIWDVSSGSLLCLYKGSDAVFYVTWNAKGDRIMASFADNTLVVMDVHL